MAQQTTTSKDSYTVDPMTALVALNDSTLKFIEDLGQRALEANKSAAALVSERVSAMPAWWPTPDTSTARTALEQIFDFRAKLLEANQRFTLDILDIWAPKPSADAS